MLPLDNMLYTFCTPQKYLINTIDNIKMSNKPKNRYTYYTKSKNTDDGHTT